jgi:hypothetical protein
VDGRAARAARRRRVKLPPEAARLPPLRFL